MEKRKNIPELRFPGFDREWEEKALNKIAEINPANEMLPEKFLYIDLESVDGGRLVKRNLVARNVAPSRAQRVLKQGDILFQLVRPYQNNNFLYDEKSVSVASTGYAQVRVKDDRKFVFQILHTHGFVKKVLVRCTGTSYPAINSKDFSNLRISIPSLPEQEKIADFLSAVDKRIELLRRKKELTELYKKGVMQKIFSREIRFRDDNGNPFPDWQEKKLGEVSETFSGGTPISSNINFYNGEIPFIKSGEIHNSETKQKITEEGLKNSSSKIVRKGDLLFALYGATSGETAISKIDGAINQAILCIKPKLNNVFLYYFLYFKKNNIIGKYLQGGQGNLSAEIVKSILIPVPSLTEQQKIAEFLQAIDKKIELLTKEIEKTELFKKGLLQKMFV